VESMVRYGARVTAAVGTKQQQRLELSCHNDLLGRGKGRSSCLSSPGGDPARYHILIQFGTPIKLVSLIKLCLNKTYEVCIGEHLSDKVSYSERFEKKKRCFIATAFQLYFLKYASS
jgi:hypothetical protein